jgi:hypothetical protein
MKTAGFPPLVEESPGFSKNSLFHGGASPNKGSHPETVNRPVLLVIAPITQGQDFLVTQA